MSARPHVVDAFDDIRAARDAIVANERPRCPVNVAKLLYDCLRESAPCASHCEYQNDWIGPQKDV